MKTPSGKDILVYSVAAVFLIATIAFLALGKDKQATVACSIGGLLSVYWGFRRRSSNGRFNA